MLSLSLNFVHVTETTNLFTRNHFFCGHIFHSTQGRRGAKNKMHALWVSLKDNVKCGNKINDVIKQQTKCSKGSGCVSEWEKMNGYNRPLMQTPTTLVVSRPSNTLARLHGKLPSCMLLLFASTQHAFMSSKLSVS